MDDAGVGGGVVDRLRELGEFRVVAFNGAGVARDRREHPNRRSESWFAFAEQLGDVDLDGDEQLAADLLAPAYKLDSQRRRVVEAKSATKRRLGRSPDRADAVLMAFVGDARPVPEASLGVAGRAPAWARGRSAIVDACVDADGGEVHL